MTRHMTLCVVISKMSGTSRKFDKYRVDGIDFFFKYDELAPDLLHIYVRHLTTPAEALEIFVNGKTAWNVRCQRFETYTETHGLYWFWLQESSKVMIISCFRI